MIRSLALIGLVLALPVSAAAADEEIRATPTVELSASAAGTCALNCGGVLDTRLPVTPALAPAPERASDNRRGLFVPLYVSLIALETLDTTLTLRGLQNGAAEANPAMAGVTGSPAAFVALKMGAATASILAVERLRQRHPKTATALIVLMDSVMATVVANNIRLGAVTPR